MRVCVCVCDDPRFGSSLSLHLFLWPIRPCRRKQTCLYILLYVGALNAALFFQISNFVTPENYNPANTAPFCPFVPRKIRCNVEIYICNVRCNMARLAPVYGMSQKAVRPRQETATTNNFIATFPLETGIYRRVGLPVYKTKKFGTGRCRYLSLNAESVCPGTGTPVHECQNRNLGTSRGCKRAT